MEIFATIVMLAWVPVVVVLFAVLSPPRAVIIAFLTAWLFLPVVSYRLPFLPDYTKMSATCAGIFLGALLFDAQRLLRYSPSWVDLPVAIFCVCPFFSSMMNGLGTWDGISATLNHVVAWGMPYLVGRVYFTDAKTLRELAIGFVIGGLLYVPFCLLEIRISPKLHQMVYGTSLRGVQMRFGGWRPSVFMDGGLQLGLFMAGSSLVSTWLWWTGALKRLWGMSASSLVLVLFVTTVLCRTTGALALLFAGLGILWFCSTTKNRLALVCLLLIAPTYIFVRSTGIWHGEQVVALAGMFSKDRADSFQFRIKNEDILIAKALRRPIFGWGGWGRARVHDEWDADISTTDGRWVIELGGHGILGVATSFTILLAPLALLISRFPTRRLLSREMAPALSLAVIVTLYAIDSLPNALPNPAFVLAGGAVVGFGLVYQTLREPTHRGEIDGNNNGTTESIPLRRLHPGSV